MARLNVAETDLERSRDPDKLAIGILCTIVAGFVIAGMDGLGKYLMQEQSFVQVVWGRYLFHTLAVFVVFGLEGGLGFIRPAAPKIQMVRAAALLFVTLSMYAALQVVPLADATAVMFFAPVLVTALAGIVLGEHVGWRRYTAVVAGFVGVLIIVQPGTGAMQPAILLACAGAFFFALYILLTRKLQGRDSERTTLFHATAAGAVALTVLVPFYWTPLSLIGWCLLITTGLMGAVGHFLWIKAFHMAPAASLSPFLNAQLVAAALYSAIFFGDPLTIAFILGASLIVGAGLFIWYRERSLEKRIQDAP